MNKRLPLVVSLLLAALAGQFLVACESKNGPGSTAPAVTPTSPGETGKPPVPKNPDGTSDSGGGTGVQDKVFESYIVDPATLPAYREHLAPLFANIQPSAGRKTQFPQAHRLKTWYIAPVELDRVGKDALGIIFVKSDTQQLARQTMKEIWIDKRVYDRMAGKDQAELILHEIVMNLYLLKFVKMSELCRQTELIYPKEKDPKEKEEQGKATEANCAQYAAYLDQVMPPAKAAPLSEQDNENIRSATGWILHHARESVSEIDVVKMLQAKGFDKRLFSPENYLSNEDRAKQDRKISRKDLLGALRAARLTGDMPDLCVTAKSDRSKPCKLELIETEIDFGNHKFPGVAVRLTVEGETPIELSFITPEENTFSINSDYEGGYTYSIAMADAAKSRSLGDRIHFGFLVFREENAFVGRGQLSLTALTITPGIITAVDKEGNMPCEARPPRVRTFIDEPILALRPDRAGEKSARVFAAVPPIAVCSKP